LRSKSTDEPWTGNMSSSTPTPVPIATAAATTGSAPLDRSSRSSSGSSRSLFTRFFGADGRIRRHPDDV
jgi:hypothetical protein